MKSAEDIQLMRTLFRQGWSKRRIAAELGISRNTLERYLNGSENAANQPATKKKKLEICLDWLKQQHLTGEENSETLRQRLQEEMQIQVSHRTLLRAIQHGKKARQEPSRPLISNRLVTTAWRIGPYHFTAAGALTLRGARNELSLAQRTLLLLFVRHPNQLISYEEIANHLWPQQKWVPIGVGTSVSRSIACGKCLRWDPSADRSSKVSISVDMY